MSTEDAEPKRTIEQRMVEEARQPIAEAIEAIAYIVANGPEDSDSIRMAAKALRKLGDVLANLHYE